MQLGLFIKEYDAARHAVAFAVTCYDVTCDAPGSKPELSFGGLGWILNTCFLRRVPNSGLDIPRHTLAVAIACSLPESDRSGINPAVTHAVV